MESWFTEKDDFEVIQSKIEKFNNIDLMGKNEVTSLLEGLSNLGINTYYFSFCANQISPNLKNDTLNILIQQLQEFHMLKHCDKNRHEREKAFCALYLVTYYYFLDGQIDEMGRVLTQYEDIFLRRAIEKENALIYQIRGRFFRLKGDIENARQNDLRAIELLESQNIENIQAHVTYAGTVLRALQDTGDSKYVEEAKKTIPILEKATRQYPMVPRYYYLLAKIYLYTVLYDDSANNENDYLPLLNKAKQLISTAVDKENPNHKSYYKNISKYNGFRQVSEFIMAQKKFNSITLKKIEIKNKNAQDQLEATLHSALNRYMELLALFVSIIALIMAFIQSFTNGFTAKEILQIVISMNAGLLAVYSSFLCLLHDIKRKYVYVIFISFVIVIAVYYFL